MRFPWISGLVTAVILVAMLTPAEAIPDTGFNGMDVVVHVVTFTLWGAAVSREFRAAPGMVLLAGMGLALGTELLQLLIPGRAFSLWDMLSDLVGLVIGVGIGAWWRARRDQESSANRARAAGESHANAD